MPIDAAASSEHSDLKVLVIDDDELVCAQLDELLAHAGIGSLSVTSVAGARAAMEVVYFPVIVVDRWLGDGDGLQLCSEYRKRHSREVHILMYSGADSSEHVALGLAAGADAYVGKHAGTHEVLSHVRQFLGRN